MSANRIRILKSPPDHVGESVRRSSEGLSRLPAPGDEERYDVAATSTFNGLLTTFTFTCTRVLAAQINAVGSDADVVLMMMGGNDVHFATLVRECFVLPSPATCRAALQQANSLLGGVRQAMRRF